MQIKNLHSWDLSYSEAAALQRRLSEEVQFVRPRWVRGRLETVAGLDCSISRDGQRIIASAVVLRFLPSGIPWTKAKKGLWGALESHDFELIETATASLKVSFPYIPGLLSFREAPACIAAVEKLKKEPDVFLIDGQGIAHPRRLGLAAHLGLFFDGVTIGCAKSRLTGYFEEPAFEKGSYSLLEDKNETIGAVLRTRTKVKPVFVSVGNKCTLEDAIRIVLACTTRYRLPEPTRLAHQLVSKKRDS